MQETVTTAFGDSSSPAGVEAPCRRVGGVPIFDGDMDGAVTRCLGALDGGAGLRVATANLDFLANARSDEQLRLDLDHASLVTADGWPVVFLARLAGATRVRRVTGVDLVTELFRCGAERGGLRVAFYGSDPANAARARDEVEGAFPGVEVVSVQCPPYRPLTPAEEEEARLALAASRPELVLVALGSPRQERVVATWFEAAPAAIWIGVGGTLDFFSSRRRRAPLAVQRAGLEWAFRLVQEPGRLWRRYLLRDLPALAALMPGSAWTRLHGVEPHRDRPATARQRAVDSLATDSQSADAYCAEQEGSAP